MGQRLRERPPIAPIARNAERKHPRRYAAGRLAVECRDWNIGDFRDWVRGALTDPSCKDAIRGKGSRLASIRS